MSCKFLLERITDVVTNSYVADKEITDKLKEMSKLNKDVKTDSQIIFDDDEKQHFLSQINGNLKNMGLNQIDAFPFIVFWDGEIIDEEILNQHVCRLEMTYFIPENWIKQSSDIFSKLLIDDIIRAKADKIALSRNNIYRFCYEYPVSITISPAKNFNRVRAVIYSYWELKGGASDGTK